MPVAADNKCPPTMFLGCANGDSGKANTIKQLAPNDAINQVSSDAACKYNNMAMAINAPIPAIVILRKVGRAGAALRKKIQIAHFYDLGKMFSNSLLQN